MTRILPRVLTMVSAGNQRVMLNDQCDCACAYTPCPDPVTFHSTGSLQIAPGAAMFSLPGDWHGLFVPSSSSSLAVLNQPAYELWSCFSKPQVFDGLQFDVHETRALQELVSASLLLPKKLSDFQLIKQGQQLSAWIHVTDRCNLRCSYCYLPHVREDMTLETGRAVIEAIFRSATKHGYRQVKLKYAGGEPLLRFPLVLKLHTYAQQLAAENSLELDGVVLSNGTLLTKDIVADLHVFDLRLMISLDGTGNWHDIQRPYAGGRGSFEDVVDAVEIATEYGLVPHISITVSGRNALGLPGIVAWILDRSLPFSINFYRLNDFSVKHEDLKLEEEKIIEGMLMAFGVIEKNLPEYSLLPSLTDRANLSIGHEYTCSVGKDYLVFDQNGHIAKCQMKMAQPIADIHSADPLTLVRSDKIGIQNVSVKEKEGCRDCQWRYWCTGGCPLETYRATGRYDVKSPNCNIYKSIFSEVLRLEGLRLLKYAGEF